jgi:LmbE family N-acetylglucosaminyl deacetylase
MREANLKIAGVFAHPADMVTETGGTLALHARRGDRVFVISLTHGGRIHPNIYVEESRKNRPDRDRDLADADSGSIIAIKHAEAKSAAKILGIEKICFLDHDDANLAPDSETIDEVAELIEQFKPYILVTHHPGYYSSIGIQHGVTGQIAVAAAALAQRRLKNLDAVEAHYIRQTYFVSGGVSGKDILYPGGGFSNDLYIDITSVVDLKVRAMDQFVSQGYNNEYARKCVAGHNGHWGSYAGVAFAEPFMRVKPDTCSYLPVSEELMNRDEITMHRKYSKNANLWTIPVEESPTKIRGRR